MKPVMRKYEKSEVQYVQRELGELNHQAKGDDPNALDLGTFEKLNYFLRFIVEWAGEIPKDDITSIIQKSEQLRDGLVKQAKTASGAGLDERRVDELFAQAGRLSEITERLKYSLQT